MKRTWCVRLALLGAAMSLVFGGCSPTVDPQRVASSVGSAGGRLELQGRGSLTVPPGALDADAALAMAEVAAPVDTPSPAVSAVLELTPHGIRFAEPATLSLQYRAGDGTGLEVLRLADPQAGTWLPVGGVRFKDGVASFETTTFSFYAVVDGYQCQPANDAVACSASCECCGGASCVDLQSDPKHCGACNNACGPSAFCATGGTCVAIAQTDFCQNQSVYVIEGELPATLEYVSAEQTADGQAAAALAADIAGRCGLTPVTVSQAEQGILDACTNAPLLEGGTTIVLTGGTFSQRLASYLAPYEPVRAAYDEASDSYTVTSRGGANLATFQNSALSPRHDFFIVSLTAEAARGALVFHVYGIGWEGTPAAAWYFRNRLLPEIAAGTRSWQRYLVVEWTDDGDGAKGAGDTFTVRARDVP